MHNFAGENNKQPKQLQIAMKKIILFTVMVLMTVASYGRKHVSENAVVVADTIYYAKDMSNVSDRSDASYYRLLLTKGTGMGKQELFQDFYMNGKLKAEGGYSFVDLGNDRNTVLDGEVTTYYPNGKEKAHGTYKNGKREGYFTVQMRDGGIAVVQFEEGVSKHNYFTVTAPNGDMQRRPLSEIQSLL